MVLKKRVDLQPVHAARHKADGQAAQPCPEPVAHCAAEDAAKARRRHEIAEVIYPHGIAADGGRRLFEPALRRLRIRHLGADAPAERVELFNALEVVAMVAHALHDGQRLRIRCHEAHRNTVRDGKRLSLRAICLDHTAHGLLDPVRLRPGDRELVADLHRHICKKIIVHTCLPISKKFPGQGRASSDDSVTHFPAQINGDAVVFVPIFFPKKQHSLTVPRCGGTAGFLFQKSCESAQTSARSKHNYSQKLYKYENLRKNLKYLLHFYSFGL